MAHVEDGERLGKGNLTLPDVVAQSVGYMGPVFSGTFFIPTIIGEGGQDWPAVAAGTTLFLIPILCFTVLLRKHLLRGITFGAIRK